MDEIDDNDLSDFSNPEADVIGDTTSSVPNVNHTSINNANAIVTCTVTTGLTSPNGVNNGKSKYQLHMLICNDFPHKIID